MPSKDPARRKEEWRRAYDRHVAFLNDYLTLHPCCVCGEADLDVLVFHHVNPHMKSTEVTKVQGRAVIEAEMQKCVVLCANCHRRVHKMMRELGV